MRVFAALTLAWAACTDRVPTPLATSSAPPTTTATAPATPPPPSPSQAASARRVERVTFAVYAEDRLVGCIEGGASIANEADSFDEQEIMGAVEKLRAEAADIVKRDPKGASLLAGSCLDTFHDRIELASCDRTKAGPKGRFVYVIHYYAFEAALEDDAQMRDCIGDGGKWTAVSRDSREFRAAKEDALLRRALKR